MGQESSDQDIYRIGCSLCLHASQRMHGLS
jgi:hypothetical protein